MMKCVNCGKEIDKADAKFCPHCGKSVEDKPAETSSQDDSNKNIMIIAITAVIVIVIIAITAIYVMAPGMGVAGDDTYSSDSSQSSEDVNTKQSAEEVQTTQSSKSWQSVGSFDGSGSGTKTITVPAGQIRIDLSAYPIKNYATNHLYVSGSNGKSAALDWGPRSAVATHSDSISFTSSSQTTFTIDYYETVSWQVQVYRYQ